MIEDCPANISLRVCIDSFVNSTIAEGIKIQLRSKNNNTTNSNSSSILPAPPRYPQTLPWWFRTLLRDTNGKGVGLHGPWHNMQSNTPALRFCAIEKIGTKQWRQIFATLIRNETLQFNPNLERPETEFQLSLAAPRPPPGAPSFVFLRDPLERFLSAYIDKCERKVREGHCEPAALNPRLNATSKTNLLQGMNRKQRFEAYVDAFPLKWNVHFFPQSFYCDGLFRHVQNYDFVGTMGPNFYRDLETLGKRHSGTLFQELLHKVFELDVKLNNRNTTTNDKQNNVGVETSAPSHVLEYYTARSIRRVLQYLAIDYTLLDFEVPEWALQMLAAEDYFLTWSSRWCSVVWTILYLRSEPLIRNASAT